MSNITDEDMSVEQKIALFIGNLYDALKELDFDGELLAHITSSATSEATKYYLEGQ